MDSTVRYTSLQLLSTLVLLCSMLSCSLARMENAQGSTERLSDGTIISKSNARLIPDPGRSRRESPGTPDNAHSRQKRATVAFGSSDMDEILQVHNNYRASQCASDMMYMKWDDDLAEQSQAWADKCVMEHGFDSRAAVSAKFSSLGQNLFMMTGGVPPNNAYYIAAWYDEINYYTYNTMGCQSGKMCGHYTQVVWASSYAVGCGKKQCASLTDNIASTTYNNALYVVCNYGPGGNVNGNFPFVKGTPCSGCGTNAYWCHNGLCPCTVDCGCGTRNDTTCTCDCKTGWVGGRCCSECSDNHANCNNGWYPQNCGAAAFVPAFCPKMCGVCSTSGATCTLTAEQRCDSSSSSPSTCPVTTTAQAITTTIPQAITSTTVAQSGSTTTSSAQGSTTTAMDGSTTSPSKQASTTQGSTSTAIAESTTTAAQEVRDAQADAGVLFELQGSLDQWASIWINLQGILVDAINTACNSDAYYLQCCPNAGPKLSSYAAYVSRDTVLVADGYPTAGDSAGTINAVIYAEPLKNNELCQPAAERRRRHAQEKDHNMATLEELLYRVRRTTVTFNFMPQEVLFVAVQDANSNIVTTLAACCNVTVAAVSKSKAIVTTTPPETTAFPGWAIAVLIIGVLGILAVVAALFVFMKLNKPNKTAHVSVDSGLVTKTQVQVINTNLSAAKDVD